MELVVCERGEILPHVHQYRLLTSSVQFQSVAIYSLLSLSGFVQVMGVAANLEFYFKCLEQPSGLRSPAWPRLICLAAPIVWFMFVALKSGHCEYGCLAFGKIIGEAKKHPELSAQSSEKNFGCHEANCINVSKRTLHCMVTWSNVISASITNDFVENNNKKIRSKHS